MGTGTADSVVFGPPSWRKGTLKVELKSGASKYA